ncbi:hypothetical protein [Flavisolibacter ginsengisoli]|jgi:hypothetical protein|uniref:Uncharacterized protein n=1 Tax=Flavisolibacter ginsengisoli DSM 18119 TaxID=1121884 RepID=A0A1M4ZMH0_9BACT|nr:hypothetical protein [Flavisolibacter ginsengisoli]SHF19184.1 hypothetical protein SAMN02745131_01999 [Flavisolibacter ginsengisoli DSM 18119]
MPKQVGYIKGLGTIDGNLNFYRSEGEYRVRLKPGVDTHRFHTDPVFEGARITSGFFGRANTLASLIYRYVYTHRRCNTLYNLCKKKAIALKNQGIEDEQVLRSLYEFLTSRHCLPITAEDLELYLPGMIREADKRKAQKREKKPKPDKDNFLVIIEAKPSEEDEEYLMHYMDDYNWKAVFDGAFAKDYKIPICFGGHLVDKVKKLGLQTMLTKPKEKIIDEWVKVE